jgi:hypothetical protein
MLKARSGKNVLGIGQYIPSECGDTRLSMIRASMNGNSESDLLRKNIPEAVIANGICCMNDSGFELPLMYASIIYHSVLCHVRRAPHTCRVFSGQ